MDWTTDTEISSSAAKLEKKQSSAQNGCGQYLWGNSLGKLTQQGRISIKEIVFLCLVMSVVWILLILPIVFYQLGPEEADDATNTNHFTTNSTCKQSPNATSACEVNGSALPQAPRNFTCRDQFSLIGGICLARCDSWEQSSPEDTAVVLASLIIAPIVAIIGAIAVFAIAIYRRKAIFVFPSVFIIYHTLTFTVISIFVLILDIDRYGLSCGDEVTVAEALDGATPFCTVSGAIVHYGTMNHTLWWFIHVSCVFWKVVFPIHARSYQSKYTYIHIALVVVGLAIPVLSVIAAFATGGFVIQAFPPQICGVENPDAQYYSLWLFINLLLIAGITMLIIICWKVRKQGGFLKTGTKHGMSTPEKKLIVVFSYYILFASLTLAYVSLALRDRDRFSNASEEYFICEARGYNPDNPCPKNYEQYTYPELASTVFLLMGFLPAVNLIFVVDIQQLKQGISKILQRIYPRATVSTQSQPTTSSSNDETYTMPPLGGNEPAALSNQV